jgi:hypothetical protein
MIIKGKNKGFSFIVFIIIFAIALNCSSNKIKKQPDSENKWEQCPFCHGTGYMMITSSRGSADDVTNNSANKYASCFEPFCIFGMFAMIAEGKEQPGEETNPMKPEYDFFDMKKNQELSESRVPERSMVTKKIKCPHCEGLGWRKSRNNVKSPIIKDDKVNIIINNGEIEYRPAD